MNEPTLIEDSAVAAQPPPSLPPWSAGPEIEVTGGKVRAYVSRTSGLRALLIQTDEPLCSLHVVIATEADTNEWSHKDDGLPHTLEHAIFKLIPRAICKTHAHKPVV